MLGSILTILLSTALGAVAGSWVGKQEDRRRSRERLQGVARAQWADLRRIRQELGPPRDELFEINVYGSDPIPPTLHEWTSGLVPELANIDPRILLAFFRLERALHNYGVSLRAHREVREALLDNEPPSGEGPDEKRSGVTTAEELADTIREQARMQREKARLEDQARFWHDSAVDERKRAYEIMDDIEREIRAFLPSEQTAEALPAKIDLEKLPRADAADR